MFRSPLARRIPGNERLNSVGCLLPFFDEASVKDVAKALMSGGDDLPGRHALINPVELKPKESNIFSLSDIRAVGGTLYSGRFIF